MTSTEIDILAPPGTTNLKDLASSTLLVFDLLRPWCKSNYSSPALQSIKTQAKSYMQALELSVVAAQHGFNIAEDALAFIDLMDSCSEDERQDYLRRMLEIARLGENNAKEAHGRFRGVRVMLLQLIREAKMQPSDEDCQDVGTDPKLNELEKGISTLEKFSTCISLYISWWNAISMSHISQSKRLQQVVIKYNSLRARDVVQKWRNLRQEYVDYTDKIRQIQDADPEFALEKKHNPIKDGQVPDIVPIPHDLHNPAGTITQRSKKASSLSQEGWPVDYKQPRKRDRLAAFGTRVFMTRRR
ncbi:hypothetical protein CPB84DRAFT_1827544 [Gymnopilus junonius]|uniref:Uncharacterized protein n=1 Tax=Gymnopilus junonius TaxID=109634 RepID=A0A9P5TJ44_GYMJU|nr:hypothetical protein CPB84DRAFT_1827544 [Gymnopilus junonius]